MEKNNSLYVDGYGSAVGKTQKFETNSNLSQVSDFINHLHRPYCVLDFPLRNVYFFGSS